MTAFSGQIPNFQVGEVLPGLCYAATKTPAAVGSKMRDLPGETLGYPPFLDPLLWTLTSRHTYPIQLNEESLLT
jgi:hypothetical protein